MRDEERRSDVFHRRCGCSAGELVEKALKYLMVLECAHSASILAIEHRVARSKKGLPLAINHAFAKVAAKHLRDVFHRRGGCGVGDLVEQIRT